MTLESSLSSKAQDGLKSVDKSTPSKLSNIACENQVGGGTITPKSGQNELPPGALDIPALDFGTTDLDFNVFQPGKPLITPNEAQATSQTQTAEGSSATKSDTQKPPTAHPDPELPAAVKPSASHPFTEMRANSKSLAESTTALNADVTKSKELTSKDEKNIGTYLQHLTTDLRLVEGRHPANDPQYKQQVEAAQAAVSKLQTDLSTLEHSANGKSALTKFDNDEKTAQTDLQTLYQPALDKTPIKTPTGGDAAATNGLILNVENYAALKTALESKPPLDFTGIRIWDNGSKPDQLYDKNGNEIQPAFGNFEQMVNLAHQNGKTVTYTFGEPDTHTTESPPSEATMEMWAQKLSQWSASQKPLGPGKSGGIDVFEDWNEPNYSGFWGGSAAELAKDNLAMNDIIHKNDPTAKVASPSVSFWSNANSPAGAYNFDEAYFTAYQADLDAQNGGKATSMKTSFNQIDFHGYTIPYKNAQNPGQDPEQLVTDIDQMKSLEKQFGLAGPLVETEAGVNSLSTSDKTFWGTPMTSQEAANEDAQSYLLAAANGAVDSLYAYGDPKYGGLTGPGQTQTELNNVQSWLQGATIENQSEKDGIYTINFEKDGKQETVAWAVAADSSVDYTPGAGYSHETAAGGQSGNFDGTFTLTDEPVLLTSS
jgi:hypothetical protein